MKKFEEKKFNIGPLKGISAKNIEEHLKLYSGYVKSINTIFEKVPELIQDPKGDNQQNAYLVGELMRRVGFEFNGMRNHEYYFASLEGGAKALPENSGIKKEMEKQAGSVETWLKGFKHLALTRGIGWAIIYWDKQSKQLIPSWIDEQHVGQLNGLSYVLGIDMWEHAFVYDYPTSEKKKYVEAFFENLNWEVIEENFKKAQ
ncbi:superoxide dismutase [Candidatus Nomurabacteria bacterium]|nr:superoxide dismutase [Candidatus Nomurabacteria bacterium]